MCKAVEEGEVFYGGGREMGKENISKQIYENSTKLVRLDAGWHKLLKVRSARAGKTIKEFLEEFLSGHWNNGEDNE